MGEGRGLFLHTKLGKIDHYTSTLLHECQVVKAKILWTTTFDVGSIPMLCLDVGYRLDET
jgi:hypothetical protein